MSAEVLYITGEEIQAGDRAQHHGTFGTIVVVSTGEDSQYIPGYEDQAGMERGVLFCDDDGQVIFVRETDEGLSLIGRS
jgi:hypothetical protein